MQEKCLIGVANVPVEGGVDDGLEVRESLLDLGIIFGYSLEAFIVVIDNESDQYLCKYCKKS